MRKSFKRILPLFAVAAVLVMTAGSCDGSNDTSNAVDAKSTEKIQKGYQQTQPIPTPTHGRSQKRQNLHDIEAIEMNTTATYTFAFQQGIDHPIFSCDSIGLPIPSTDQLTNPLGEVDSRWEQGSVILNQMEPTGVYTGDSSGTHNVCLNKKGQAFDFYWEGFVAASTQPLHWDTITQTLVQDDVEVTAVIHTDDGSGKDGITTPGK